MQLKCFLNFSKTIEKLIKWNGLSSWKLISKTVSKQAWFYVIEVAQKVNIKFKNIILMIKDLEAFLILGLNLPKL
jgi:hypothetical protein